MCAGGSGGRVRGAACLRASCSCLPRAAKGGGSRTAPPHGRPLGQMTVAGDWSYQRDGVTPIGGSSCACGLCLICERLAVAVTTPLLRVCVAAAHGSPRARLQQPGPRRAAAGELVRQPLSR